MNFVADLLIDYKCTMVLTVVEYFSKMYMLIPLSSTTAEHIARAFFQHVVAHHRLACHIISKLDPRFTG